MRRRNFLAAPLAAAAVFDVAAAEATNDDRVDATGDGVHHTPQEYTKLLARLTEGDAVAPDSYSIGGAVQKLEERMASLLGKEVAVWLPTGTLANHLAVRLLAGSKRRVLVQADSHLFRDEGDCAQTLSGLHLVPLGAGKPTFALKDVEDAAFDARDGRVATPIGAIQVETPVRRHQGARFDWDEMRKIVAWARAHQVGLHLDGARLFLEAAYSGHSVKEYAAMFDTVYVSMYKYFNAAAGAVLAGPKSLLGDLFQTRRMFGGGLPHVWPYAAVAMHYLDGFEGRFKKGVETSEAVIQALSKNANFGIERVANGSNIFKLRVFNVNAPVYKMRLFDAGVSVGEPVNEWFTMQVNETWGRASAAEIGRRFVTALG